MVCKKLEEMDFKSLSCDDLCEYIYSLDKKQGRKFKRLEGDALETSRVGIIRHLMSCLNMSVKPDPQAMKEIMEDASNGRAVFDMVKAQNRIDSFRQEDPEIIQRREKNNVMGLRRGNTPKKTSVRDGLSASNKLCIVVEKQFEEVFREWLVNNRFIKVCVVGRVSSGVLERALKNFWSVTKISGYPKDLKRQLVPKTGTVKFEHYADGLSLATALSEQADITLPESVIKKLTPPPAPAEDDQKENTTMLRAVAVKNDLPKWILSRVGPHQLWEDVINKLYDDSHLHPDYKQFDQDEITEAAFKALVGSDKVPTGALKALVFYYLKKNSIHPEPASVSLVQQVYDMLVDHRIHNPQDATIRGIFKEYLALNPVVEQAAATTQAAAAAPVAAPTNLKAFIESNLASDGSFTKDCPDRKDLMEKAKLAFPNFNQASFDTTLSLVRRTRKNATESDDLPSAQSSSSPKPEPEVKVVEPSRRAINPGGVLTIRKVVLANLAPDGGIPPWCKTMKDFHVFLKTVMSLPSYKSVENIVYVLRKEIKAGTIEVPKAPEELPVISETQSEGDEQSDSIAETSDDGGTENLVPPIPPVPPVEDSNEVIQEPPSSQLGLQEQPQAAMLGAEEDAQSKEVVVESSELVAMRAKVRRARLLFDELDGKPELLGFFFEFREILAELNTFGEFFERSSE